MLVLTRKLDESIVIGDSIEVKILAVDGGSIKLGIQAPRTVPVHRKEVYDEIMKENQAAKTAGPADLANLKKLLDSRK